MEKKPKEKSIGAVSEDLEDEIDPDADTEDGDKEETDDWNTDY